MNCKSMQYSNSVLGRGLPHECSKSTKLANVHALLNEKEKDQLASDVIKQKMDKDNSTASISTRGTQLRVKIPPRPSKTRAPGQISASTLMTRMKTTRTPFRGLKEYQERLLTISPVFLIGDSFH